MSSFVRACTRKEATSCVYAKGGRLRINVDKLNAQASFGLNKDCNVCHALVFSQIIVRSLCPAADRDEGEMRISTSIAG